MRYRDAMMQDVGLLYQRLAKYRRKRDRAIRMIDRIDAEISKALRQAQQRRAATARSPNNCKGVKCLACGIMFRILKSKTKGCS